LQRLPPGFENDIAGFNPRLGGRPCRRHRFHANPGVGAIFRAPLAGALFAAEILYRDADLETEVIVPAAVSSIVG
jgi:hypothetical protein